MGLWLPSSLLVKEQNSFVVHLVRLRGKIPLLLDRYIPLSNYFTKELKRIPLLSDSKRFEAKRNVPKSGHAAFNSYGIAEVSRKRDSMAVPFPTCFPLPVPLLHDSRETRTEE